MNLWDQLRDHLQQKVSPESYDNWLRGTSFAGLTALPCSCRCRTARRAPCSRPSMSLCCTSPSATWPARPARPLRDAGPRQWFGPPLPLWDSRSRRFPHQPAEPEIHVPEFCGGRLQPLCGGRRESVADSPSRSYNPLFLYGGVGMGKTHLMHAIGRELIDKYPSIRVVYTSSERFMNEMIPCLRTDRMPHFSSAYRGPRMFCWWMTSRSWDRQRAHAGRVFPYLQRAPRSSKADRDLERFARPQSISGPGGASALAFRMGPDGGYSAARPWKRRWRFSIRKAELEGVRCRRKSGLSSPQRPNRMCGSWKAR